MSMNEEAFAQDWSRFCGAWRGMTGQSVPAISIGRWKEMISEFGFKAVIKVTRHVYEIDNERKRKPDTAAVFKLLKDGKQGREQELLKKDVYLQKLDPKERKQVRDDESARNEAVERLRNDEQLRDEFFDYLGEHLMANFYREAWKGMQWNSVFIQAEAVNFLKQTQKKGA